MTDMLEVLCTRCQTMFDDVTRPKNWMQPRPLSGFKMGDVHPLSCRMCAVIHRCYQNNQETTAQISELAYAFDLLAANEALTMSIIFHYIDGKHSIFKLAILGEEFVPKDLKWMTNLSSTTVSTSSIQFLKIKLRDCLTNHKLCCQKSSTETTWHPTRLINVQLQRHSIIATLIDGRQAGVSPYVSLSHCWGGHKALQLSSEEEASFRRGRLIDDFPKTFRDAMNITIDLGIHYIWIDSLCIFQDSLEDKSKEISAMGDVYSHAFCNIAATSAAASTVGLSFPRDPRGNLPFWVATGEYDEPDGDHYVRSNRLVFPPGCCWSDAIETGPLNQRAWVMQENLLSSRILHFTQSQVMWECYDDRTAEIFPHLPKDLDRDATYPLTYPLQRESNKIRLGFPSAMQVHRENAYFKLYVAWTRMMDTYTQCFLTDEQDRLPAISGIVRIIGAQLGDTFVAGFWQSRLPEDLLWMRALGYSRLTAVHWQSRVRHAPTWSWANANFAVWSRGLHHHFHMKVLASSRVQHISSDNIPILTMEAKVMEASTYQMEGGGAVLLTMKKPTGALENQLTHSPVYIHIYLDDPLIEYPHEAEVSCIIIYEYARKENEENPFRIVGLVLRLCNGSNQRHERAGIFYVCENNYESFKRLEPRKTQHVHIV